MQGDDRALSKVDLLDRLEQVNSPKWPTRLLWVEIEEADTPQAERAAMKKAAAWLRKRRLLPG